MKNFYTLLIALVMFCLPVKAQLVLNEIYTDPGAGKHEFFELYNPDLTVEQVDNYTLVSYYKTSNKSGFYVLDFPAMSVLPKGFLVASSSSPFDYQGVSNSGNTSFDWNNAASLAANNGKLSRWDFNGGIDNNTTDGNSHYDYIAQSNLNDLFGKISGSGASFIMIVYKNGVAVNSGIFGSGGASSVSSNLLTMPPLFVDMAGSSPDFTIDFSAYSTLPVENVNQDAGSDNGFIRKADGSCGSWTKSSSQTMHTPLTTNGSQTSNKIGIIEVMGSIKIGDPVNGSELTYGITTASPSQLPAKISVFVDNGSVPGQLDINDQFLTATVTSSIGTNYTLHFTPYDKNIIIATKSVAGCVDNTKTVSNIGFFPLAINFITFSAARIHQTAHFNWTIAGNENVHSFELQTSGDGISYTSFKTVSPTTKAGIEKYVLSIANQSFHKGYYRLKCTDKKGIVSYSHTQRISDEGNPERELTVLSIQSSQLQFLYNANSNNACNVRVYNINGSELLKSKISFTKGINRQSLTLDLTPGAGIYFLEISNDLERTAIKFLKQ